MCLEREGPGFIFPVNSGSCPKAPGVMTKHQRNNKDEETTHAEDTEAREACYHPNL